MTKLNNNKINNTKNTIIVFIVKTLIVFFFFVGVIHSCNVVIDNAEETLVRAEQTWENFYEAEDPEFAPCDVKYDYHKRVVVTHNNVSLLGLIQQQGFSYREACGLLRKVQEENHLTRGCSLQKGDVLCLPAREQH